MEFTYKEKEMQMAPLHIGNNIQRQDKPKSTLNRLLFPISFGGSTGLVGCWEHFTVLLSNLAEG